MEWSEQLAKSGPGMMLCGVRQRFAAWKPVFSPA